jgi:transcription elongation GreA/GreB family factor
MAKNAYAKWIGATVTLRFDDGQEQIFVIVGMDEADATRGRIR